jgi:hypothetical protein
MEAITNAWLGSTKQKNIYIYIILQLMNKRSNTCPCTSKALHTIGIYGGKEEFSHIIGILSKKKIKRLQGISENVFFQNSPDYNKKCNIDEFTHQ